MDHMPTKVSQKWIENMVEKGPTGLAMLGQYTDCLQTQKKYTVSLSHAQEYENVAASWPELLTWLSFHEAHRPKALQEHIKFFLTANYKTDCTHVTEPEVFEAQELYPWKEEMDEEDESDADVQFTRIFKRAALGDQLHYLCTAQKQDAKDYFEVMNSIMQACPDADDNVCYHLQGST